MMPGAKVQKNVHTSIIRLLNFVLQIYKIVIYVLYMYFILIYKYFLSSIIHRLFHTKESPIAWDFLKTFRGHFYKLLRCRSSCSMSIHRLYIWKYIYLLFDSVCNFFLSVSNIYLKVFIRLQI